MWCIRINISNMSSYDEVKNKIEFSIYKKKRGVGFSISNSFGIHLKKNLNFKPINIVMLEYRNS